MKKKLGIFVLIFVCLLFIGCGNAKDKKYTVNGISITMQEGFLEKSIASATAYMQTDQAIFNALKEEFIHLEAIGIDEDSTLEEYGEAVIANNESSYELKSDGDLRYFTYEKTVSGKDFYYIAYVYKSDDAFWLVNFAAETSNKSTYEPLFKKWAKTVTFE